MQMRQLTKEEEERVEANIGIAYNVAKKYRSPGTDGFEDYFQIGLFGLSKAIMTFDEEKGATFATYAAKIIENEILMDIRKNKKHQGVDSLDRVLKFDEHGNAHTIQDDLADKSTLPLEEIREYEEQIEKVFSVILNELSNREKVVFLFDISGIFQNEIGEKMNLSQSYVSRVTRNARKNLMRKLATNEMFNNSSLFSVRVETSKIRILFPCIAIENVERRITEFLGSNEKSRRKADGEIAISEEKVMVRLNLEADVLEFLAEFLYQFRL